MALTAQQQAIQNQIDAFDSNTGTQLLLSTLLQAINAGDVRQGYADSAAFPTDSAFIGMIGFDDFDSSLRYVGRDLIAHKIDSADIVSAGGGSSFSIQGSTYGYNMETFAIDRFSLVSDGNAVDQGDLTASSPVTGGMGKSSTHAYRAGGYVSSAAVNSVQAWPMSAIGDAVAQPATLSVARYNLNSGPIQPSAGDFVFYFGGRTPTASDVVDKHPIAADASGTDVGDLYQQQYYVVGSPSGTDGYLNGKNSPGGAPTYAGANVNIYKIPFASYSITDTGYDVLNENDGTYSAACHSSTHSYQMGGYIPTGGINVIGKYPFAADANSTDVGDLTSTRYSNAGNSSTTHGYSSGGRENPTLPSPVSVYNIIDKFPFASDGNATDVGDLNINTFPAEGTEG